MHFLSIPIELRLSIYSELLVQNDPIEFKDSYSLSNPCLLRVNRQSLNVALLRVNKTVNREATAFLYSNNRFRFPDAYTSSDDLDLPCITPFLQQIGANVGLLRHICINFPILFDHTTWEEPELREELFQAFQLIGETCPGLKTVELSSMPPDNRFSLHDVDLAAEMLRILDDRGFKAMPSLEKAVVVLGKYDIDEEDMALRESLMRRMLPCKWSIELTKLTKKTWISSDDMFEFDNYEDCEKYDNETLVWQLKWEEREEREWWKEEYYHRRNDPYWRNDSDYD
ncbi:hypothetical protein F4818DRAFT_312018 [Hypoxylon cercidicola]|nr:hypothetical protein F4818DRAFT_312018 [Hypoxylon cercidicola]